MLKKRKSKTYEIKSINIKEPKSIMIKNLRS